MSPSAPASAQSVGNSLSGPPEHLDHDLVSAGSVMLTQAVGDVVGGASQATRASMNLSLPGGVRSASVKPSRLKLFT